MRRESPALPEPTAAARPPARPIDAAPGRRAVDGPERFPFTAFCTGWYRVAATRDLKGGRIVPVTCLGRDLVAFRGTSGLPHVLDAVCPHLGAHLKLGTVVGDAIACRFHGRRILGAPTGCESGPTVGRTVRAWPVRETDGAIMIWHDPHDRPPGWTPAPLPEYTDPAWTAFRVGETRIVATHVQELCENGIDLAHFAAVHGRDVERAKTVSLDIAGETLRHVLRQKFRMLGGLGLKKPLGEGTLEFSYSGLGRLVVRATVVRPLKVDYLTVMYFTPLDGTRVCVYAEHSIRRRGPLTPILHRIAAAGSERAIRSDMIIMESKAYLPAPNLDESDGPIPRFRSWAVQFH